MGHGHSRQESWFLMSLFTGVNLVAILNGHVQIFSDLTFFLEPETLRRSKVHSLETFRICSAIGGTVLRFLASLNDFLSQVNMIWNGEAVPELLDSLFMESNPDLFMSSGNPRFLML
jgi:hypothetical protein